MRILLCFLTALGFSTSVALADSPTIGVNVNLLTGTFQSSGQGISSLPTIPVPLFNLRVPIGRFAVKSEWMPPIGPIGYTAGGQPQRTRLSYFSSELDWHSPNDCFEVGAGSTVLNQITYYDMSSVVSQASRVVGFRLSVRGRLENTPRAVTDLTLAFTPSMHGVQDSRTYFGFDFFDPESASLTDITAQRTQMHSRFSFSYGLRYMNYVARFTNTGRAADHDRVLMPFAGVSFRL